MDSESRWRSRSRRASLDSADVLPLTAEWPGLHDWGWLWGVSGAGSLSLRVGADGVGRRVTDADLQARLVAQPEWQSPFVVSGKGSHVQRTLSPEQCVRVSGWDAQGLCDIDGLALPPDALLLHVALYELDPSLGGVLVAHDPMRWERLRVTCPRVAVRDAASLPELSEELERLVLDEGLGHSRLFTMDGLAGLIVAFGDTPREAVGRLLET